MTIPDNTIQKLVSHNIQRDIGSAMKRYHTGIRCGLRMDSELEEEISDIFQKQMKPLHNELREFVKQSTPPKPCSIYKILAIGAIIGACFTVCVKNKVLMTSLIMLSLWIRIFDPLKEF